MRNKNVVAEGEIIMWKSDVEEKEKEVGRLIEEVKSVRESVEEEKRNFSFQEKRIEYKENVLN